MKRIARDLAFIAVMFAVFVTACLCGPAIDWLDRHVVKPMQRWSEV